MPIHYNTVKENKQNKQNTHKINKQQYKINKQCGRLIQPTRYAPARL